MIPKPVLLLIESEDKIPQRTDIDWKMINSVYLALIYQINLFQAPDWNEGSFRQGSWHRCPCQDWSDPHECEVLRQVQGG